ncbi:hypothetical protein [Roseovarius aestuariivivens]|uniref:hypothetical protein n=1 Tax=Roseovarius aestuariivivens TaxID=1888910 RepID=UPI001436B5FE|nr:hypothetical protein [Roseovarius aestuariivivens]
MASHLEDYRLAAGLMFQDRKNISIETALQRVSETLRDLRVEITATSSSSSAQAIVQTDGHLVHLALLADVTLTSQKFYADKILHVCVETRADESAELPSEVLLLEMTTRLYSSFGPDHVMWLDASAILSSEEFAELTGETQTSEETVEQPLVPKAKTLPGIEDTHTHLQAKFLSEAEAAQAAWLDTLYWQDQEIISEVLIEAPENIEPEIEDIRDSNNSFRMSAWLLSIAVSIFALPVGAALIVINLLKGENLRLVSHCAALVGLFSALNVSGAHADTVEFIGRLLV